MAVDNAACTTLFGGDCADAHTGFSLMQNFLGAIFIIVGGLWLIVPFVNSLFGGENRMTEVLDLAFGSALMLLLVAFFIVVLANFGGPGAAAPGSEWQTRLYDARSPLSVFGFALIGALSVGVCYFLRSLCTVLGKNNTDMFRLMGTMLMSSFLVISGVAFLQAAEAPGFDAVNKIDNRFMGLGWVLIVSGICYALGNGITDMLPNFLRFEPGRKEELDTFFNMMWPMFIGTAGVMLVSASPVDDQTASDVATNLKGADAAAASGGLLGSMIIFEMLPLLYFTTKVFTN